MIKKVIDISDYQDKLDWDAVVDAGVQGVIIKITEGCSTADTWWTHLKNAQEHGLAWGVYCLGHAMTPERAQEEANQVLYLLQGKVPPMGVWYDVESEKMFREGVDTTACASAFISFLNAHGLSCGIYASSLSCTRYMTNSLQPDQLADYVKWWIADYRGYNGFVDTFPNRTCAGWQYSDKEYIGNVNVDMNEWYEDWG